MSKKHKDPFGRNAPCSCGSGEKRKRCCGRVETYVSGDGIVAKSTALTPAQAEALMEVMEANTDEHGIGVVGKGDDCPICTFLRENGMGDLAA